MFHNIGKKIKAIASGMCWVGMIGICVSVIIFVSGSVGLLTNQAAVVTSGSYCAVSGLLLLLMSFFAYGFGELVENSRRIVELLGAHPMDGMKRHADAAMPAPEPEQKVEPPVQQEPVRNREPRVGRREARHAASAQPKKNDTWQCPECGTMHPAIRPLCLECGEPKPNDAVE